MNHPAVIETLTSSPPQLSVGILAADPMDFGSSVKLLEESGVHLLHLDVMDGLVWPQITAGSPLLAGLKTSMLKDVHLLIDKPERQIENFAKAGADIISFSVEYCDDVPATLDLIGQMENANDPSRRVLRGVSLNPATPVDLLASIIDKVDVVLLLAVGPDTGKQNFLLDIPDKVAAVKELSNSVSIFVDGAVTKENIAQIAQMGPNVIVTGSAAFRGDLAENIRFMREQISG